MPSNGDRCTVCELPPRILQEIDLLMTAGQDNGPITRWLRENRIQPIPSRTHLNKHRANDHYLVRPEGHQDVNDSLVAQGHRNGMNIMQRVQMNIAHTALVRLANVPAQLNEIEEITELYAFTKNQLAIEFENSRAAPEVYVHPITEEEVLIYPTTNGMMKLIPELRRQLKEMVDMKEKLVKDIDVESEISIQFMNIIKGEKKLQDLITQHLAENAAVVEAEVIEEATGNGEIVDEPSTN